MELTGYSFDLTYRPDHDNVAVGALSRGFCLQAASLESLKELCNSLCLPCVIRMLHFLGSENPSYSVMIWNLPPVIVQSAPNANHIFVNCLLRISSKPLLCLKNWKSTWKDRCHRHPKTDICWWSWTSIPAPFYLCFPWFTSQCTYSATN